MNDRLKEIMLEAGYAAPEIAKRAQVLAELIVRDCMAQCEQVAEDADFVAKSDFVTDAGRQIHEGMWGGAKNCAVMIKQHFGVVE
jgi:hypothetical protein